MFNNYKIKKIIKNQDLYKVVEYLKKGFKWSEIYSNRLISSLEKEFDKLGFYGFYVIDDCNNIIASILTLYQGSLALGDKKYLVVNLSSWYVSESHRGYKSIMMLKYITNQLSDYIITDISPNKSAESILKVLGYNKLATSSFNLYFLK